jgi:tripeptide aminopeptidase
MERAGVSPQAVDTGGGADANVFNSRGLECVNLANGMLQVHTPDERIAVSDLERMLGVTLELVELARHA